MYHIVCDQGIMFSIQLTSVVDPTAVPTVNTTAAGKFIMLSY